jgi:hypothetical protein
MYMHIVAFHTPSFIYDDFPHTLPQLLSYYLKQISIVIFLIQSANQQNN